MSPSLVRIRITAVEDCNRNTDSDAVDYLRIELVEAVSFAAKLVPRVVSPPSVQRTITAVV